MEPQSAILNPLPLPGDKLQLGHYCFLLSPSIGYTVFKNEYDILVKNLIIIVASKRVKYA